MYVNSCNTHTFICQPITALESLRKSIKVLCESIIMSVVAKNDTAGLMGVQFSYDAVERDCDVKSRETFNHLLLKALKRMCRWKVQTPAAVST